MQFENFQNHEYLLFTNCTRRSCVFFIYSTFNKITSFPWKLNRYSYRVRFGINCTALDQSKLSNFVECTIIKARIHGATLHAILRATSVTRCGYTVAISRATLHAIFDQRLPSSHAMMFTSRNPCSIDIAFL